jgi:hypothetical protein
MQKLKNKDLIWEEKGIILGIIHHLLSNITKYKKIYVKDKFYYEIVKSLFPNFQIYNYEKNNNDYNDAQKYELNICIKTKDITNNSLVLNNINNIDVIRTRKKNFFILPWFNVYNPIIMFKYNQNKKKSNIDNIKKKIKKFNVKRLENCVYGHISLNTYNCNFIFWDIFMEHYILKKYSLFFRVNIDSVSNYLYQKINGFKCSSYIQNTKILPLYIPYIDIKKQHNYIKKPRIKQEIDEEIEKEININQDQKNIFLSKFMGLVNKKIGIMNNILFDYITQN